MEEDLRSSGAGLRGFKSHPRHHYVENHWGFVLAMNFTYFGFFHFLFPLPKQFMSVEIAYEVKSCVY
jgi:hypothetical protein